MNKPLMTLTAFFAGFFILTASALAQTGSFNVSLPFAGGTRVVACYVPPDYDSTKSYGLLVGLHGMGHNGNDYRDALISSAGWPNGFKNTIFMFPDGGSDQGKDFYAPAGDEAFIGVTLDYARSKYSIDPSNILLQGFSLGGRSALKYASAHSKLFKGLLLNTPAIQGLADLNNNPALAPAIQYDGFADFPVYVTIGLNDGLYVDPIRLFVKKLRDKGVAVQHVEIAGMGHTIPANNVTAQAITFFNTRVQKTHDIMVYDVRTAKYSTSDDVPVQASIQNLGSSTITALNVFFTMGGKNSVVNWTGQLAPNQSVVVETDIVDVPSGGQDLSVSVENPDATQPDPDANNNGATYYAMVRGERGTTDAREGFETMPRWLVDSSGNAFAWSYDNSVALGGTMSLFAFNTILVFYTQGLSESVTSPFIDMSSLTHKSFSFDYAYNFHRYTAAVLGVDSDFADTLVIEASTNSGGSYTELSRKAGAELATFPSPIMNPTAIDQCFVSPSVANWRHVDLSLNNYAQEKNLLVRMRYISGLGGFINIDNLTVGSEPVSVEDEHVIAGSASPDVTASPNPASDNITFTFTNRSYTNASTAEADIAAATHVRMYNSAGEEVHHHIADPGASSYTMPVASLPTGMYTASISRGEQTYGVQVSIVR